MKAGADSQGLMYIPGCIKGVTEAKRRIKEWREKMGNPIFDWWSRGMAEDGIHPITVSSWDVTFVWGTY